MFIIRMFIIFICFSLVGCGGVTCYFHSCYESPMASATIKVGEQKKAIKQTHIFAPGGYSWGLASADPSIVKVEYIESGRTTYVYLKGISEGRTEVFYINRMAFFDEDFKLSEEDKNFEDTNDSGAEVGDYMHFTVNVVQP